MFAKINYDGARPGGSLLVRAGGLFRDAHGKWLGGFSLQLSSRSVLEAELKAVAKSLQMAILNGFHFIQVETDSYKAYQLLVGLPPSLIAWAVLHDCWTLRACFQDLKFQHVCRDANKCVDHLAKLGLCFSGFRMYFSPPVGLISLLEFDSCMLDSVTT